MLKIPDDVGLTAQSYLNGGTELSLAIIILLMAKAKPRVDQNLDFPYFIKFSFYVCGFLFFKRVIVFILIDKKHAYMVFPKTFCTMI